MILFASIVVLIAFIFVYLFHHGTEFNEDDISKYWEIKFNKETATGISVYINAYCYQLVLFSTYASLKEKTTEYAMKATKSTILMVFCIYHAIVFPMVYVFGSKLNINFFVNLKGNSATWETYILRFDYLILIICHIPYIFYPAKECFLVMIDEVHRRSVSKSLALKMSRISSSP
jgi:amino acid permease